MKQVKCLKDLRQIARRCQPLAQVLTEKIPVPHTEENLVEVATKGKDTSSAVVTVFVDSTSHATSAIALTQIVPITTKKSNKKPQEDEAMASLLVLSNPNVPLEATIPAQPNFEGSFVSVSNFSLLVNRH